MSGAKGPGGNVGRIVRWLVVVLVIAGVFVGGFAMNRHVTATLDEETASLRARLEKSFHDTPVTEVEYLYEAKNEGAENGKENWEKFLGRAGPQPSMFERTTYGFHARYTAKAFGRTHDLEVRWTDKGGTVHDD